MSAEESKSTDSDTETPATCKEKICKVCGDKALGYNFNALTCESCKAFFRRNALKNKEFKCPFNKKCEINTITRRFCQLCRLIKCFEIGMRKEYIMSEDDKREKRKKIETNRAIKKRAADSDVPFNPKHPNLEKKEKEEEVEDEETKKAQTAQAVKINLLNMASSSKKTYQKKHSNYDSSSEPSMPFPSPGLPESSPESVSVTESRTCNVFSERNGESDSSQSRSVEIYRISKANKEREMADVLEKECGDTNLIQIILDSEFSKPSAVYTNSTVGRQNDVKVCNSRESFPVGGEYIISEADVLELAKSKKSLFLESSEGGKKILVIRKKSGEGEERENPKEKLEHPAEESHSKKLESSVSTPLLTSLINSRRSSEGSTSAPRTIGEEIIQDVSRNSTYDLSTSIDSILSEAIKLEYEAYTSMNSRMNSRELNDAERAKLNELIVANKALLAPLEDDMTADDFGFNVRMPNNPQQIWVKIANFNPSLWTNYPTQEVAPLHARIALCALSDGITSSHLPCSGAELRALEKVNSQCKRSMLVDVLNLTAVAIRRLIKMSKKINAFKNMCQDDQIALLKGGCTEMMILRSAMTYDPDRDSWKIPQSKEKLMNIKVDVLKEAGGKVFEEHQRFLQTFEQKWRNDENIMLILSAIALFTPDRARVVHYDVIKLEQNSYYYLLRRYLESIYQGCEARLTFLKLIHKISELHKLNEDHVRVYLDVNPKEVEPLLIEIFDLKPH